MINWKKLVIAIPITAIVNMFLLYGLFMNPMSQQIIFSESLGQSPKLVAVWTQIDPVPQAMSLIPALIITPVIFSFFFAVLYDSIPGHSKIKKGLAYAIILWGTIAVFFELFTPLGLFGEPLHLLAYELGLWFIGMIVASMVLSLIYSPKQIVNEQ
jgi:hypothetical protein